jgi:predicted Zn-dependent peptidase
MIDCRRERLPNGLRLITVEMPSFHSAIALVYLRMGPRFESLETSGLSHVAEHVLFKGTERFPEPEQIARELDALGGELNGATLPEYTELYVSCHSRHFLRGLELLCDVILRPRFDPGHIETERQVILEEIAQYRDATHDGVSVDELSHGLMWPRQAHAFSPLGDAGNVSRFTADAIETHYRRHLVGANLVVCIAGNFARDAVREMIAATLGSLPRGERILCPTLDDGQTETRCMFRRGRGRMAAIRLCYKAFPYHDPRVHPLLVLSDILGGGVTSRLFSRLRERQGLVYDVWANTALFSDCGWVDIATTTSQTKARDAVAGALEEIDRVVSEGVAEDDLQTIKDRVACHMEILEDCPSDVAEWLGTREMLLAPETFVTPADEARELRKVTADETRTVARGLFRPDRRSLVYVGPCSWHQRRRIRALVAR